MSQKSTIPILLFFIIYLSLPIVSNGMRRRSGGGIHGLVTAEEGTRTTASMMAEARTLRDRDIQRSMQQFDPMMALHQLDASPRSSAASAYPPREQSTESPRSHAAAAPPPKQKESKKKEIKQGESPKPSTGGHFQRDYGSKLAGVEIDARDGMHHRDPTTGQLVHWNPRAAAKIRLGYKGDGVGCQIEGVVCVGCSVGELGLGVDLLACVREVKWVKIKIGDLAFIDPKILFAYTMEDRRNPLPQESKLIMRALANFIEEKSGVELRTISDTEILCQFRGGIAGIGVSFAILAGEVNGGFQMYGGHITLALCLNCNAGFYLGISPDRTAVLVEIQFMGFAVRVVIAHKDMIRRIITAVEGMLVDIKSAKTVVEAMPLYRQAKVVQTGLKGVGKMVGEADAVFNHYKSKCSFVVENKSMYGLKLLYHEELTGSWSGGKPVEKIGSGRRSKEMVYTKRSHMAAFECVLIYQLKGDDVDDDVDYDVDGSLGYTGHGYFVAVGWNLPCRPMLDLGVKIFRGNELDVELFRNERVGDPEQRHRKDVVQRRQRKSTIAASISGTTGASPRLVFTLDNL